MNNAFNFAVSTNFGRGGEHVSFPRIIALAQAIVDGGWLPTSIITVDEGTVDSPSTVYTALTAAICDHLDAGNHNTPEYRDKNTVSLAGIRQSYTQILDQLKALAEEASHVEAQEVIVTGNTRGLALALADVFGLEVADVNISTVRSEHAMALAVRDNAAHSLATKLDSIQRLKTALALVEAGEIKGQQDLRKIYNVGTGQKLWVQVQAVQSGLSHEQAVSLPTTGEGVKAVRKALQQVSPKADLLQIINSEPEKVNAPQCLSGAKIRSLVDICHSEEVRSLVEAIANGQELIATQLCRTIGALTAEEAGK